MSSPIDPNSPQPALNSTQQQPPETPSQDKQHQAHPHFLMASVTPQATMNAPEPAPKTPDDSYH